MKHSTYKELYKAHLGAMNKNNLLIQRNVESDPFNQGLLDIILEKDSHYVQWDIKPFTTDFLSGSPRERLDQTFFAFILRVVAIIKEECYTRTFQKPSSHDVIMAWTIILRSVLSTSLALLYNIRWTPETIFNLLEPTIMKLVSKGDVTALRKLLNDLGIKLAKDDPYQSEIVFGKLNFLPVQQFSSFYWRFLHWMAEADSFRDDTMALYKKEWRQLIKGPLYRTIRCGICQLHFQNVVKEYENEMMDGDLSKIFFKIHNRTHALRRSNDPLLQEPDYMENQFQDDVAFMRQALLLL